jgi:hypothetical protein
MFLPPYLAIVARMTAQLKMKPVIIMNLGRSTCPMFHLQAFEAINRSVHRAPFA